MSRPYRSLAVDEATPGMTLSDNVLDAYGHVLLTAGAQLTEATLQSLRRHGIEVLSIAAEEDASAEDEDRARAEARLEKLFRHPAAGDDDATDLLKHCVRYYRLGGAA